MERIRTAWIKLLIAYHRKQAESYTQPVLRSVGRDEYVTWMHNQAKRHTTRARELERLITEA